MAFNPPSISKSASPDDSIPFINTTPARQSVAEDRKLIRSHVMRGKNRRKPLPPRSAQVAKGHEKLNDLNDIRNWTAHCIPANVGNEFSCTTFADRIGPDAVRNMWKLKHAMSPLEFGMVFNQVDPSWLETIGQDAACLHLTAFVSQLYLDYANGHKDKDQSAQVHLGKTLSILQKRLLDGNNELLRSDSTILVVVGLTMAASGLGDFETATKHLDGLYSVVAVRGGVSVFKTNKVLQTKLRRAELGVALATGQETQFFPDLAWESYLSSHDMIPVPRTRCSTPNNYGCDPTLEHCLNGLDARLREVWKDLHEFVRIANVAMQGGLGVDSEAYQEVMVSVHYRLFMLRFVPGSVDETLRLGSLAFASSLFLQWRSLKTRYEHLAGSLRRVLALVRQGRPLIPDQLRLWLYVVCIISVFDDKEQAKFQPALTELLRDMNLKTWDETGPLLKSVLWVSAVHDQPAKSAIGNAISGI